MRKIIFSIILFTITLSGCSSNNTSVDNDNTLTITTTYYPLQLIGEEIGGDAVNITSIYPEDSDPHSYELTPKQTIELAESDLVIVLDENEEKSIINAAADTNVLIIGNHLEDENHDEDEDHDEDGHVHDESTSHLWITPIGGQIISEAIYDTLVDLDPSNEDDYTSNYDQLTANLTRLNMAYENFADEQSKPLIVSHDAYHRFEEDYSIEYLSLYGEHHDDEPTSKEIKNVIDTINSQSITTIFSEQNAGQNKLIQSISEQTGANVDIFYNLESASSTKQFDSIIELYEYNLELLEKGQL